MAKRNKHIAVCLTEAEMHKLMEYALSVSIEEGHPVSMFEVIWRSLQEKVGLSSQEYKN